MHKPSAALRRAAILPVVAMLALILAACSSGDGNGTGSASEGGGTVSVENGNVDITSADLEFDASTIVAPAGEAFTVTFTNAEGVPHDFAIFTEEGGEQLVTSDVITGPDATTTVDVSALEPGEYYFQCNIHPDMNGTVVVEEG